ncbi:MAG: hypothetical protein OCD00_14920 [Colwellia sp.]
MNKLKFGLMFVSLLALSGCSLLYEQEKGVKLETLTNVNQLPTGRTRVFVSDLGKKISEYYIKRETILLGENSSDLYLIALRKVKGFQSNFHVWEVLHGDNDFDIKNRRFSDNKFIKNKKIKKIDLFNTDKNCKRECVFEGYSKFHSLQVTLYSGGYAKTGKRTGSLSEAIIEYIDYSQRVNRFNKALKNHENKTFPKAYIPKQLIDYNLASKIINNTSDSADLLAIDKLLTSQNYTRFNQKIARKIQVDNFEKEYQVALNANLTTQKRFLKKYKYKKDGENCFYVKANTLNIRRSDYSRARKVGEYKKGDRVCSIKIDGQWTKTNKGWVFNKYLTKEPFLGAKRKFLIISDKIDDGDFFVAKNKNSVNSYKKYLAEHPQGKYQLKADKGLLNAYRNLNTFDGFMQAYQLSNIKNDIQQAYQNATTNEEFKKVEIKLVDSLGANNFVKTNVLTSSESKLEKASTSSLLYSIKGMVRDYKREINISLDQNSGLPFKYAAYEVKLKIKLDLNYSISINGKGKDFFTKTVKVNLTPENNYSKNIQVNFDDVLVHGEMHMLAGTLISALGNMFGLNTKSSDMDIATKLNSTSLSYEVISVLGE